MNNDNLIVIIQHAIDCLLKGDEIAFDGSIPSEVAEELNSFIHIMNANDEFDEKYLSGLFAATGPIQECSVANGWSVSYLTLASKFDDAMVA